MIGTRVVCIDGKFGPGAHDIYNALPKEGQYYIVRDLVPGIRFDLSETLTILLDEITNKPNLHGIEPGFAPERFRELDEDRNAEVEHNIESITAMMEWDLTCEILALDCEPEHMNL